MSERSIRNLLLLFAVLSLLAAPSAEAQLPVVRIGLSIDGPWERNEEVETTFEREIRQLLESGYDVRFSPEKRLLGDWTAVGVKANIDRLFADPEVDFVITLGVLGSNDAARREALPKPVFAPFVIEPDMQGIPYQVREERVAGRDTPERSRISGVQNLSYVALGDRVPRDVSMFREIVPFSRITILTMQALGETVPELRRNSARQLAPLGLEVQQVLVGRSLEEALAKIPPDAEAVYIAPLLQLPPGDFDRLVQALIERKLPSFSLWGRSEVEKGVLASLALDLDLERLARRIALNMHRVLLGEQAQDLSIDFEKDERLTINAATARAIGVYPSFAIETVADILYPETTDVARSLSLSAVVREASQVNLDLAAADRSVAAGLQLVREARSGLLPQADVSALGSFIDRDRAESSLGRQGQRQASGTAGFSQLIYSEQVKAGYHVERNLQDLRQEEREQLRLDVVLEAAESYLNVLRAKMVERIQRNNLGLTRSNLELAQARVELGAAGREEVFRWESQIATNRKDVIDAGATRNQAEIAVNRVLNRPIEESFATEEAGLDDPELVTSFEQIRPYIENRQSFRIFRRFMVTQAFEGSPELRQLEAGIRAQQRALLATRRAFYVPTVGLQADLTGFKNGGAGSSPPELPEMSGLSFPLPNSLNWSVGLSVTLPVFQGGALRARRTRAQIQLDELNLQRQAARQRVEQRVRSVLHKTGASFAGIDLSRDAAEAARRNLELVTDSYRQGVINIITLLDAQNRAP